MTEKSDVRSIKKFTYVNERENKIIAALARKKSASEAQVLREAAMRLAAEEGIEVE